MTGDLEQRLNALMRKAQAGEALAWRELLGELSRRLSIYYSRRLGQEHAADLEDLVQETLLAIHRRRVTYDASQPFTAWAFALARYKLIDYWRRRRVRPQVALELVEATLWEEPDLTPESRLDLERMLAILPAHQQQLIRDVKIEGLSLAEAGARAGISPGAAKVALHRAMSVLMAKAGT